MADANTPIATWKYRCPDCHHFWHPGTGACSVKQCPTCAGEQAEADACDRQTAHKNAIADGTPCPPDCFWCKAKGRTVAPPPINVVPLAQRLHEKERELVERRWRGFTFGAKDPRIDRAIRLWRFWTRPRY